MTLEELRSARSHRRLSKEEKQAYIAYWSASGKSKRQFCVKESLSVSTFSSWFEGSKKTSIDSTSSGFVEVELKDTDAFNPLETQLRFELPNGLSLEGNFKLSELKSWIKELSDAINS